MASPNKEGTGVPDNWRVYDGGTSPPSVPAEHRQIPGGPKGPGGGDGVDAETKNYVDAKMDSVKAQNDARFAEVIAKLDAIKVPSIWQLASLAAAAVVSLVAIFGVFADRFDGGLAAHSLVDPIMNAQDERDSAQDAKLDRILMEVERINDQSEESARAEQP